MPSLLSQRLRAPRKRPVGIPGLPPKPSPEASDARVLQLCGEFHFDCNGNDVAALEASGLLETRGARWFVSAWQVCLLARVVLVVCL